MEVTRMMLAKARLRAGQSQDEAIGEGVALVGRPLALGWSSILYQPRWAAPAGIAIVTCTLFWGMWCRS